MLIPDNMAHEQINDAVVVYLRDLVKQVDGDEDLLPLALTTKDARLLCKKLIYALVKCDDKIAKRLAAELDRLRTLSQDEIEDL